MTRTAVDRRERIRMRSPHASEFERRREIAAGTRLKAPVPAALAIFAFASAAWSQPLFDSDEPLSITLDVPIKTLVRKASRKPTVTGTLRYAETDGSEVVLDVEVTTRGKSRLEECSFPPLSVNLKRQQVVSTVFAGQNKLKLVTQCKDKSRYQLYLNQEYAIYKIYNVLSDRSFRVRMLEVTYRDSAGKRGDEIEPAFFIESDDAAAERLGMTTIETDGVKLSQLEPSELSTYVLFQFMIGNTDWSVRKGPDDEDCCHNGKVIAPPKSQNGWVVLPYDFDQAGLIDTDYAAPNDVLPIRNVRQRLYRGYCFLNPRLESTIAKFNNRRAAIEALINNGPDGPSRNRSAFNFLQEFYAIVNDPEARQKKIVDACLGKKKL